MSKRKNKGFNILKKDKKLFMKSLGLTINLLKNLSIKASLTDLVITYVLQKVEKKESSKKIKKKKSRNLMLSIILINYVRQKTFHNIKVISCGNKELKILMNNSWFLERVKFS